MWGKSRHLRSSAGDQIMFFVLTKVHNDGFKMMADKYLPRSIRIGNIFVFKSGKRGMHDFQ